MPPRPLSTAPDFAKEFPEVDGSIPAREVRATYLTDGLMLVSVVVPGTREPLSPGEAAIVGLAERGLSNREIAEIRRSTTRTVANQLASAYRKLGVSGRRALKAFLRGGGLTVED